MNDFSHVSYRSMAEDETEWAIVVVSTALFVAIHGVLAYTSHKIIANKEALHIANVSPLGRPI